MDKFQSLKCQFDISVSMYLFEKCLEFCWFVKYQRAIVAYNNIFRALLAREKDPPIDQLIAAGAIAQLVHFLYAADQPKLQYEAAWYVDWRLFLAVHATLYDNSLLIATSVLEIQIVLTLFGEYTIHSWSQKIKCKTPLKRRPINRSLFLPCMLLSTIIYCWLQIAFIEFEDCWLRLAHVLSTIVTIFCDLKHFN